MGYEDLSLLRISYNIPKMNDPQMITKVASDPVTSTFMDTLHHARKDRGGSCKNTAGSGYINGTWQDGRFNAAIGHYSKAWEKHKRNIQSEHSLV